MASKFARLYPDQSHFISEAELEETERLLEDFKFSQSISSDLFRKWVEQREKSIDNVDRLEKKFYKLHQGSNIAHGVGAAMEVAGGLAMLAGAILTACGQKSVGEFLTKKVSPVSLGAGVATSVSTSVAEVGLTHSILKEVQEVLKKDEVYTQKLMKNLQHSKKIDKYFRRIFNCSVLSDIFADVVRLCMECIPLLELGYEEFSKLWSDTKHVMFKCKDFSDYAETVFENVHTTMKNLSTNRKAQIAVRNICGIIQESPLTTEIIKLGLRVSIEICDVFKVDIVANLLGLGLLGTTAGVKATQGLLGTALIAVNVLSVINAVENVQKGSSKYSKLMNELKLALSFELNSVRSNYSKLL